MKCVWGISWGKGQRYVRALSGCAHLLVWLAVCSTQVWAGNLGSAYTELKNRGIFGHRAKDVGQLCEHLARLELEKQYPRRRYDLQVGIGYGRTQAAFKGELDVVVFDRGNEQAVLVAEVKCWGDFYDAARKARQQRRRFQKQMESGEFVGFFPVATPYEPIDRRRFEPLPDFILISQKGGERAGFDLSMDFDLNEVKVLLRMLRECDSLEECQEIMHPEDAVPHWNTCEAEML